MESDFKMIGPGAANRETIYIVKLNGISENKKRRNICFYIYCAMRKKWENKEYYKWVQVRLDSNG